MKRREPFSEVLASTLSTGWSEQYGTRIEVRLSQPDQGVHWLMQPWLSACYVPNVSAPVRRFLRDSIRYTPVRWRLPIQWLLGTLISTPMGLQLTASPAFSVTTSLPYQRDLLVVPGNQRIRIFDFNSGKCRIILKQGFDAQTMLCEIRVRGQGVEGPFPKISEFDRGGRWFEEPIIDGFALPRCPPSLPRKLFEQEAFEALARWLDRSVCITAIEEHLDQLDQRIGKSLQKLKDRFRDFDTRRILTWKVILTEKAFPLGRVPIAEAHGDFQPGNIMVDRRNRHVSIIDWEHSMPRFCYYDFFVYTLGARFPVGLTKRLLAFVNGALPSIAFRGLDRDSAWRRAALALFLLEDIEWRLRQSAGGPYLGLSHDLISFCEELALFGSGLSGLFDTERT